MGTIGLFLKPHRTALSQGVRTSLVYAERHIHENNRVRACGIAWRLDTSGFSLEQPQTV